MTSRSTVNPAIRGLALAAAVGLDAVAFATVLRPSHGYTSTPRLLAMLAVGTGVGLGANIIAGAATATARRRPRSLWAATTTVSTLGVVLALFITTAAGSRIVVALRSDPQHAASADPAARADFRRWQATVVPIVVRWMDAMRTDRAFSHGLSTLDIPELARQVDRAQRTLTQLARSLATDASGLPHRPSLGRLTRELATALAIGQRTQASYRLAIKSADHTFSSRATHIRLLVDRGNRGAEQSTKIMFTFSLQANKLGASLFAGVP